MDHKHKIISRAVSFVMLMSFFVHAQNAIGQDQRTWRLASPMPTARTGVSAVELDGLIYVMGGVGTNGDVLNLVEIYNPDTDVWDSGPELRTARFNAASVVYNDTILLMGGADSVGVALKKVEVFVPSENRWESFDNLNEEREGLAAVVLDNEVYVMGGAGEAGNILDSVEYFDSDRDRWELSDSWSLDIPRALFAHAAQDNVAYAIGGFSTFGPVGLVQQYDEDNGPQNLAPLMSGRGGLAAAYLDDAIYTMGGRRSTNEVVNAVERLIPEENRWEVVASLNTGRERFAALAIDDRLFVIGGNGQDGQPLNSVEVFEEVSAPLANDDTMITDEDVQMSINVLINDTDPDGGMLVVSSFSNPASGTLAQLSESTFTYDPNENFFGTDSFSYVARNEGGGTAQATVQITVRPVNDPPKIISTPVMGAVTDSSYTYSIAAVDVDNDELSFSGTQIPGWLQLTDLMDGTALLQGVPTMADVGEHAVKLSVFDGVESVEQEFTLTVVQGAPTEVMLLSPPDGSVDQDIALTLRWSVPGSTTYDLEVSIDSLFSAPLQLAGLNTDFFELQELEYNTTYFWRVRGLNSAGIGPWSEPFFFRTVLDTSTDAEEVPRAFLLHTPYPNPFQEKVTIAFDWDGSSYAPFRLSIYDMNGRLIRIYNHELAFPGRHSVEWDGYNSYGQRVSSGIYIIRLAQNELYQIQHVVLIR